MFDWVLNSSLSLGSFSKVNFGLIKKNLTRDPKTQILVRQMSVALLESKIIFTGTVWRFEFKFKAPCQI